MIGRASANGSAPRVVLIGNPNTGKSTVFNRLTGLTQRVGNYPGVTVERKVGTAQLGGEACQIVDLPGTYSLAAHSPDEMVAVDVLLGRLDGERKPDLVLEVVDATNLDRNLYLFSQVIELGVPVVVALTMVDVARVRGIEVDVARLAERIGVPVVPLEAHRGHGIDSLREALERGLTRPQGSAPSPPQEPALEDGVARLEAAVQRIGGAAGEGFGAPGTKPHRFELLRLLVDVGGYAEERWTKRLGAVFAEELAAVRRAAEIGDGAVTVAAREVRCRYSWIRERTRGVVVRPQTSAVGTSEKIDRVLTHRVFGLVVFAAMMLIVFQSIFTWAAPLQDGLEAAFIGLSQLVGAWLPEGTLRSLVADGVIRGVGQVAVFLPQILILFFFIGLLEDCGYMARAAFLMDKIMSKAGLSGKSFIPMLSGFACAVPGILATRVIEDRRERLATILVTPLLSCSARLPVYSIFIGTFIPDRPILGRFLGLQALTMFSLYALGVVTAVAAAWALRRTLLKGARPPFVLELPSYKLPLPRMVLYRLWDRGRAFLFRAGTTILAISVIVWALSYFPRPHSIAEQFASQKAEVERSVLDPAARAAALAALDRAENGAYLRGSFFGRMGQAVEPLFLPLGWDWRISMAALASFPAREVIVSTLGTIYNLGSDVDSDSDALRDVLRQATWDDRWPARSGQPVFTVPVALSILVFFALCCQCGATVAAIRREANSWGWAWFAFGYMTILAYVGALVTYQIGSW